VELGVTAAAVGRRQADDVEQQRLVDSVESFDAADGRAAEGVAVVGAVEGDELGLARLRSFALLPVLEGDFQRGFDGAGSVAGIEDVVQVARRQLS
jgi:hypothetical protein